MTAPDLDDLLRPTTGSVTVHPGRGRAPATTSNEAIAARARVVSAALVADGVGEGDVVALTLANDVDSIVGLLSIWFSGATAASLPLRRKGGRGGEIALEALLVGSGCRLHLSSRRTSPRFEAIEDRVVQELEGRRAGPTPDRPVASDALIQFTSGSVGRPKGVVVPSRSLAAHVSGLTGLLEVDPIHDTTVSWLPLSHDMGLVGTCLVPLCAGAHAHLMTPRDFVTRPQRWLELVAATRSTILAAPDFAWRLVAAALLDQQHVDLSSVRVALTGAERVRRSTIEALGESLVPAGLAWEAITPTYGMAEATLAVTCSAVGAAPTFHGADVGLGQALPGVEIRTSTEDVVSVRSAHGFRGYLSAAGVADPRDDAGWFTTGDAGVLVDGDLVVRGRVDEVVVVAGRNLYAEDVEHVVLDELDGELTGVAAFRGADESRFALVVEPRRGVEVDEGLRRRIRSTVVGALETRPSSIDVVQPGQLPRTNSGKVQRGACRDLVELRAVGGGA